MVASLDLKRLRNPNSCALAAVFGSPVGHNRSTSVSQTTLNHGAKDIQPLKFITSQFGECASQCSMLPSLKTSRYQGGLAFTSLIPGEIVLSSSNEMSSRKQ